MYARLTIEAVTVLRAKREYVKGTRACALHAPIMTKMVFKVRWDIFFMIHNIEYLKEQGKKVCKATTDALANVHCYCNTCN